MAKIYYLDLPDPTAVGGEDKEWIAYDVYSSKKEAVKALENIWGIDEKYADCFISRG